jgi:hypothetical protein
VIRAAAEFAVRDEFEADPLLQPDSTANRFIFRGREFGLIDLALGEAGALAHQFRRTQQAANMFSAERRLRPDRRGLCADIHDGAFPRLIACNFQPVVEEVNIAGAAEKKFYSMIEQDALARRRSAR